MGDESLVGIVEVMTGEKDPRNLMLVFSILKVLMIEWDISNHVEVIHISSFPFLHLSLTYTATFRIRLQLLSYHVPTTA